MIPAECDIDPVEQAKRPDPLAKIKRVTSIPKSGTR